MAARPGFSLPEVLFAMLIGGGILALSVQQVQAYFRLQQVLVVRTELRHEVQSVQERLAQKLRYAQAVYPTQDGYYLVIPQDTCADGYLCTKDEVEVLWWRHTADPLEPERRPLVEYMAKTLAFSPATDAAQLGRLFEGKIVPGKRLSPAIALLTIEPAGANTFRTRVSASRALPRQQAPVTVMLTELVAKRSLPLFEKLPSLDKLLEGRR